jgi:PIN domain nuclease of toxin-antitoxin system
MRYLLDTTVFVWSLREPERLNKKAFEILEAEDKDVFLSAVSSWEIVIKSSIGKLTLPKEPSELLTEALRNFSLQTLSVTHFHSLAVQGLPLHHRDPFDRMLVAQARSESMILLAGDSIFDKYPVETLWCGR